MDISTFDQEIKRLLDQWPNSYSEQRRKILYNAFRDVPNFDFRDAITYCLGNYRSAPLLPDLIEAVSKTKSIRLEKERITEDEQRSAFLAINDDGTTCDREFKNKCVELYTNFMDKKITREQFYQGCDLIDQAAKLYKKPNPTKPQKPSKPYKDDDDEKPY